MRSRFSGRLSSRRLWGKALMVQGRYPAWDYDPILAHEICLRVADGENLGEIAKDKRYPSRGIIYQWAVDNKEFEEAYTRAKQQRAESRAERIDQYKESMLKGKIPADVARVAIETEKWQASKENQKYSDKVVLAGDKDNPLFLVASRLDEAIARRAIIDVTPAPAAIENQSDEL